MAFAVASCADDEVIEKKNQAKPGDDVLFELSLPNSRTVYGAEEKGDGITAYPIYWANDDKVQIYSPECAAGRNNAEYSVTPKSGQSYAEKLTKTGEYGVQWGDMDVANFYSVYPSLNAKFSGSGSDVTAKLNISSTQFANLANGVATDMNNVIMYAQTNGIEAGSTVNLKYTPYSTILQFNLALAATQSGAWGRIKVSSLTLTAPDDVAIAGDFNLKFVGGEVPSISKAGNNSNSIKVTFETAPILNQSNSTIGINVALIPLNVTKLNGWTVALDVYENDDTQVTVYTQKLDGASNLKAGMIHKISLPTITSKAAWTYDLSNWIPTLYDYTNIYLTELSLPGAWYAGAKTSDGYQATQSITDLWNAGIRAFAVETKCVSKTVDLWVTTAPLATPSNVVVSGTADNAGLSTASGTNTLGTGSGDKIYKEDSGNITLKTIFENIINCLKVQQNNSTKKPEFAVLVLSYADGGTTGMRPVDFGAWLELLYDSYNSLSVEDKKYIYSSNTIDANTTVNDVLNKLIIKVNVDKNIAQGGEVVYDIMGMYKDQRKYSYANNLPALLSYNPFMSQIGTDYYNTPLFSKMSWMNWTDATDPYRSFATTASSDFMWCFSSANRTKVNTNTNTTIPSYAQRQEGLRAMITHSREISSNGTHNVWFYFNAGGTQTTSQSDETTSATDFAKTMNPWLLEVINLKSNGGVDTKGYYTGTAGTIVESDPSPLGIVMFNQCTGANSTYKGTDIIKAIIDMNDKFKLKRCSEDPDTDPILPGEDEDDPFA